MQDLRARMQRLARELRGTAARAARQSSGRTVNIALRRNIVVAGTVGEPGTIHAVLATQDAPIVQGSPSRDDTATHRHDGHPRA